ncbi:MAG: Na+/H+ antiporter NhaA [Alphaproteobacteria bacterium]|jgi:NhaA family Na+:H+ antiporter
MAKVTRIFSREWIEDFLNKETTSGLVMIAAMFLAIICENTGLQSMFHRAMDVSVSVGIGSYRLDEPFEWWVKDVFMVFFFLQVGLELKREMLEGFLSDFKQVLLPCLAAIGGILCPALIFTLINMQHPEYSRGWAIPTATDIAFALCVLTLVGKNIPSSVKVFLLAIAIFDDLGAILIIALFYSQGVELPLIGWAIVATGALYLVNKMRITYFLPYLLLGIVLWFCFLKGGIHTTIAGVVVAMAYPMHVSGEKKSPLNSLMKVLKPWVDFLILPIFAFTSSGIFLRTVTVETFQHTLTIGIILALFIGKQIGIFSVTYAMLKLRIAKMPSIVTWRDLYGVSVVAGIGFTMSLFVGFLALPDPVMQQEIKVGVICGSILSALWGAVIFHTGSKNRGHAAQIQPPSEPSVM